MNYEELKQINLIYHHEHILEEKDVEIANKYIKHIENTRNTELPKAGDVLQLTNEHGDYYGFAHIDGDGWKENCFHICEQAYTPFITAIIPDGIRLSTSGGAWCNVPKDQLIYKGKTQKKFCFWGACGPCANGAVDFIATVNVWQYTDPNPLYENYTTKDYTKMYISRRDEPADSGYLIFGQGTAFKNDYDYEVFKRTYRAKVFPSPHNKNSEVLFLYKEFWHYLSKEDWQKLDNCQIDTRLCNGVITVKVKYDDENKKIDVFRYSNGCEPDEEIAKVPYILNRI